jgi:predicted amidohydrolase
MGEAVTARGEESAMRQLLLLLSLTMLVAASASGGGDARKGTMFAQSSFSKADSLWRTDAARDEILPACAVDAGVSHSGEDGSLRITCRDRLEYGGWTCSRDGIKGGSWYRFDAYYLAEGVVEPDRTIVARLDWRTAGDERAGQPEYAYHTEEAGDGWRHVWAVAPAPEDATGVRLELLFGWSPGGTVWWDDVMLAEREAPAPRLVKIATVYHRPSRNASAEENVDEFCEWIDRAAEAKPDIICLPEAITMIGTPLAYDQVAEPIPGPTSRRLGEMARKHSCYIEACYSERDGHGIFNTAILLDRRGELVGTYRKLYVPREEIEGGVTPGSDAPVFDTDFGRVGMMICWDVQFVEPAQRLALKGAEVILLPIWGGDETLIRARAIENHVFVVTSGYDVPSWIVSPDGKTLAEASQASGEEGGIAIAEVDLNHRYIDEWLGNVRARFLKEHREDLR